MPLSGTHNIISSALIKLIVSYYNTFFLKMDIFQKQLPDTDIQKGNLDDKKVKLGKFQMYSKLQQPESSNGLY